MKWCVLAFVFCPAGCCWTSSVLIGGAFAVTGLFISLSSGVLDKRGTSIIASSCPLSSALVPYVRSISIWFDQDYREIHTFGVGSFGSSEGRSVPLSAAFSSMESPGAGLVEVDELRLLRRLREPREGEGDIYR